MLWMAVPRPHKWTIALLVAVVCCRVGGGVGGDGDVVGYCGDGFGDDGVTQCGVMVCFMMENVFTKHNADACNSK